MKKDTFTGDRTEQHRKWQNGIHKNNCLKDVVKDIQKAIDTKAMKFNFVLNSLGEVMSTEVLLCYPGVSASYRENFIFIPFYHMQQK